MFRAPPRVAASTPLAGPDSAGEPPDAPRVATPGGTCAPGACEIPLSVTDRPNRDPPTAAATSNRAPPTTVVRRDRFFLCLRCLRPSPLGRDSELSAVGTVGAACAAYGSGRASGTLVAWASGAPGGGGKSDRGAPGCRAAGCRASCERRVAVHPLAEDPASPLAERRLAEAAPRLAEPRLASDRRVTVEAATPNHPVAVAEARTGHVAAQVRAKANRAKVGWGSQPVVRLGLQEVRESWCRSRQHLTRSVAHQRLRARRKQLRFALQMVWEASRHPRSAAEEAAPRPGPRRESRAIWLSSRCTRDRVSR